MAKFRIMSDLHLEFEQGRKELYPIPYIGEDYLILAGDIQLITKKKQRWFSRLLKHRSVIYILGNHEFYGGDFFETRERARRFTLHVNEYAARKGYPGIMIFLDNRTFTASMVTDREHSVHVVGTTLWSNIHPSVTAAVQHDINDYYRIANDNKLLTVHDTVGTYQGNVEWLKGHIPRHGADKCLVITHHAPSFMSVSPEFERDQLTSAYASDLTHLMKDVDVWVHGHMHDSFDYEIDGCRIICNPKGYSDQNTNFNIDLMVEL